jgi:acetyltransferase-like isoleucine patch superfamily enzyme
MTAAHRLVAPSDTVAPPSALPRAFGWRDRVRAFRARRCGVEVGVAVVLGRGLVFDGSVTIGDGAVLGDGCRFHVAPGASVVVGPGAILGDRCVVSAHERVEIGPGSVLADEVVLVDFDHRFDDVERPVRLQGLRTGAVVIGAGVRVGPSAALLRGVRIGDGAQVGAHAVVTRDVPAGAVVDGVPATTPTPPRPPRPARRARAGRAPR